MRQALLVFLGGGLGAVLRAGLIAVTASWLGPFPLGVLLANLLGSCALGSVYVAADEAHLLHSEVRLFLAVGVLGGFTTFSTFALGANNLVSTGALTLAWLYLSTSALGGVVMVIVGMTATRSMLSRRITPTATSTTMDSIRAIEAEDRSS